MPITWDDVTDHAPELHSTSSNARADILAFVNVYGFNVGRLGGEASSRLHLARIYLAAHLATISSHANVGRAGAVVSESAGGLSRSYAQDSSSGRWGETGYGRALARVLNNPVLRMPLVS